MLAESGLDLVVFFPLRVQRARLHISDPAAVLDPPIVRIFLNSRRRICELLAP